MIWLPVHFRQDGGHELLVDLVARVDDLIEKSLAE